MRDSSGIYTELIDKDTEGKERRIRIIENIPTAGCSNSRLQPK